jgi:hypothetical protein
MTSHTDFRHLYRAVFAGTLILLGLALPAAPAAAQDRVAIILRADTVIGEFEDWTRATGTVYVRVSLHDQRRIPMRDIYLIDFTGSARMYRDEFSDADGPHHLLVLANGQRIKGQLLNIEGGPGSAKPGEPRILSFRTVAGDEMRYRPNELARLYLIDFQFTDAPQQQPQPAAKAPVNVPGAIQVPANVRWVSTGVFVQRGQRVGLESSGQVQLSGDAGDTATPGGSAQGRVSANGPLSGVSAGALVGRIGTGAAFGIGNQLSVVMPATGELFLAVNDDNLQDNSGSYQVVIKP